MGPFRIQYSTFSTKGRRKYMEDYYLSMKDPVNNFILFLVFDGHGGKDVSEYLYKNTSTIMSLIISRTRGRDLNGIAQQFCTIANNAIRYNVRNHETCGSTMSGLILDTLTLDACFMNVGDSRTSLYDSNGMCIYETKDHDMNNIGEIKRVLYENKSYIINGRVEGVLNLTRSFGDTNIKGISHKCDSHVISLTPYLEHGKKLNITIVSDGVYESLGGTTGNRNPNVNFLLNDTDPSDNSKSLGLLAYNQGSMDNITVMTILITI